MKKIVIFASGSGTNAENIIKHYKNSSIGTIVSVFTNNPSAYVIERAKNFLVPTEIFTKEELIESKVLQKLNAIQPDLIETGITIHFVNENYDEGNIIFQKKVTVLITDTPEVVAEKIHELEQSYFPDVIDKFLTSNL